MAVESTDIKLRKSALQTNTPALNGGRLGRREIVHNVRHSLLPRVTKNERTAGVTRIRKFYVCNENADGDAAYDMRICMSATSTAGDHYALGAGTQTDTEDAIDAVWCGTGMLAANVAAGATSVSVTMEASDLEFPNGGSLILMNNVWYGDSLAALNPGDSVQFNETSYVWEKIAATPDIDYPRGIVLGLDLSSGRYKILCVNMTTLTETVDLADNLHGAEQIGTGDGVSATPTLTQLGNHTNGICGQPGKRPFVTATCGGVARLVSVSKAGVCSGYCSGGQLNMTTGEWTTPITWTTPPDSGAAIACTYRELCYSYSGLVATVTLAGTVANMFVMEAAHACACVMADEVAAVVLSWTETSASGTYNESSYPPVLSSTGTVNDTWTLTFTSDTAFAVVGASEGAAGSGYTTSDFAPLNPATGTPYFTLQTGGWGGAWANGDTIVFSTRPSAVPVWIRQVVPPGTPAISHNFLPLETHFE